MAWYTNWRPGSPFQRKPRQGRGENELSTEELIPTEMGLEMHGLSTAIPEEQGHFL